jgi:hypothetical protein
MQAWGGSKLIGKKHTTESTKIKLKRKGKCLFARSLCPSAMGFPHLLDL